LSSDKLTLYDFEEKKKLLDGADPFNKRLK